MGAVISLFLSVGALLVVGALSSIAASQSKECEKARKWEIISAIISFVVALIAFVIAVFFL